MTMTLFSVNTSFSGTLLSILAEFEPRMHVRLMGRATETQGPLFFPHYRSPTSLTLTRG